jgi:hypothetical protein
MTSPDPLRAKPFFIPATDAAAYRTAIRLQPQVFPSPQLSGGVMRSSTSKDRESGERDIQPGKPGGQKQGGSQRGRQGGQGGQQGGQGGRSGQGGGSRQGGGVEE